jgi:hypothetical protein
MRFVPKSNLYVGAPQHIGTTGGSRPKKYVGGATPAELLALMDQQVARAGSNGEKYYIMSTFFCLRNINDDEFYRQIMRKMLDCAERELLRYVAEDYVEENFPKNDALTVIRAVFANDNKTRLIDDQIGFLNANNYFGKLNLAMFQCLLVFQRNVNLFATTRSNSDITPPSVKFAQTNDANSNTNAEYDITEFGDTQAFANYVFANWFGNFLEEGSISGLRFLAEFYPLFFFKRTPSSITRKYDQTVLNHYRIQNPHKDYGIVQYSPETPDAIDINLIALIGEFSLGDLINGYINNINYLGFSPTNISADDQIYSPVHFMYHDIHHGFRYTGGCSLMHVPEIYDPKRGIKYTCPYRNRKIYLDDEMKNFYKFAESNHDDRITGNEFKKTDLYSVQLFYFLVFHEQFGPGNALQECLHRKADAKKIAGCLSGITGRSVDRFERVFSELFPNEYNPKLLPPVKEMQRSKIHFYFDFASEKLVNLYNKFQTEYQTEPQRKRKRENGGNAFLRRTRKSCRNAKRRTVRRHKKTK